MRRLTLKREALTSLTADEMTSVVGGSHDCPTNGCDTFTHGPSLDETCPTVPPTVCDIEYTRVIPCIS